jgi:hypothetical protein
MRREELDIIGAFLLGLDVLHTIHDSFVLPPSFKYLTSALRAVAIHSLVNVPLSLIDLSTFIRFARATFMMHEYLIVALYSYFR